MNRFRRSLIAIPLLAGLAILAPAGAWAPATLPTKLDYLVLASLADSPNLMSMSAYAAPRRDTAAPDPR
jgi:hypothetical protein